MAKSFLHAGQHRPVVAGLDIDHPVGSKSGLSQSRRKQIGPRDAPEHFPLRACGDAGGKKRGHGPVDRAVPATSDFMKGAQPEPTTGEAQIHLGDPEGERRS